MTETFWASPAYLMTFAAICGVAGFRVGWRSGNRFALPLAEGALGWTAFALAWTSRGPLWGAAAAGVWALATSVVSLYFFRRDAKRTDALVLRAAAYRATMLAWLTTGRGPESRPWATVGAHARELSIYLAAALLTANLASLVLGAALLNFMNAWVASLLRAARRPARVAALGWGSWSVVRVAAYIMLGAAAAAPLASAAGYPAPEGALAVLAAAGGLGVALDLALKLALSRPQGRLLAAAVDLEAVASGRAPAQGFTLGLSDESGGPPGTRD